MNILILAPHPFYQDRGTPIAVNMILKVLSERGEKVDLLTYHEGIDVRYPNVQIHRISTPPLVHGIRPGYSLKKLICDIFLFFKAVKMVRQGNYQCIHAVEESAFIALVLKWLFKIPYVYDVDSSLPQQMIEKFPWLIILKPVFNFFEKLVVRNAEVVVVVCKALMTAIERYQPKKVFILHDMPLFNRSSVQMKTNLRKILKIDGPLLMYIGNLEKYQGIDLLLKSFAKAARQNPRIVLVIIGGEAADIQHYQKKAAQLGQSQKILFLGKKPVEYLESYLSEANILISPRTKGRNTPMKLYSYLAAGKAVLATNLITHTQILDHESAMIADPNPESFSKAIIELSTDQNLRSSLGHAGKMLLEKKFSYDIFRKTLNELYDDLKMMLDSRHHNL